MTIHFPRAVQVSGIRARYSLISFQEIDRGVADCGVEAPGDVYMEEMMSYCGLFVTHLAGTWGQMLGSKRGQVPTEDKGQSRLKGNAGIKLNPS